MKLRSHQAELKEALKRLKMPASILAHVVPGGGKSMLPGLLAERFPTHPIAWFVPRLSLARQAALGIKKDFGIDIRESGNDVNPARGTRGFVTTHAALTTDPDLWRHEMARHPYLLVVDELHHAKLQRSGDTNALAAAIERLPYRARLLMTGTLETNDSTMISGIPYAATDDGYAPDLQQFAGKVIEYNRSRALAERAIVPVEFFYHDGPVRYHEGDAIKQLDLSSASRAEEGAAVWTALRTEFADQLLANCVKDWRERGDHLLVVTADQYTARKYHADLMRQGVHSALAISDADDAHENIEAFRHGRVRALVTCQMAYEGLDVPRITHLACLTHIRSTPWILQMLARAWRAAPGKSKCWAFVPNDPRMTRVVEAIRAEQIKVVPLDDQREGNAGAGGVGTGVVPIGGEASRVISALLDEIAEPDEVSEAVIAALARFNLSVDDPNIAEAIRLIQERNARSQPAPSTATAKTVAEREADARAGIVAACRRADIAKGVPFGFHQRELFRLNGKSITEMSLTELEHARSVCARLCA